MITLFHGSDHVVENPQWGIGRADNDYGPGFYCTESLLMAKEWAVGRDHDGFANQYRFDETGLETVDLNGPEYCTLHWLSVLIQHRSFQLRSPLTAEAYDYLLRVFAVDISSADVVKGYRADDSYFAFAHDFLAGGISYRQLRRAMDLGDLGRQVMVRSPLAFERLTFVGAQDALRSEWLAKRQLRDTQARRQYLDYERNARQRGDLFITHILDEEMGATDERLF